MENLEYSKMMSRMIKAFGRRVADGDCEDLALLLKARDSIDDCIQVAVDGLLSQGHSWGDIGKAIGTSRQNAFKRWGAK